MNRLKIYIAGPYSALLEDDKIRNVERAMDVGLAILQKGHYPVIPHLKYWFDKYATEKEIPISWSQYIEWDYRELESCDALFFIARSPGADLELRYAKKLGKTIFYFLEEIPLLRESHNADSLLE